MFFLDIQWTLFYHKIQLVLNSFIENKLWILGIIPLNIGILSPFISWEIGKIKIITKRRITLWFMWLFSRLENKGIYFFYSDVVTWDFPLKSEESGKQQHMYHELCDFSVNYPLGGNVIIYIWSFKSIPKQYEVTQYCFFIFRVKKITFIMECYHTAKGSLWVHTHTECFRVGVYLLCVKGTFRQLCPSVGDLSCLF